MGVKIHLVKILLGLFSTFPRLTYHLRILVILPQETVLISRHRCLLIIEETKQKQTHLTIKIVKIQRTTILVWETNQHQKEG